MKLTKKEVKKYYSFGLVGIDDEWIVVEKWKNFTEYKNIDNLTITTFNPNDIEHFLTEMFIESTSIVDTDEVIVVASPDVHVAIKETMKEKKDVQ